MKAHLFLRLKRFNNAFPYNVSYVEDPVPAKEGPHLNPVENLVDVPMKISCMFEQMLLHYKGANRKYAKIP